MEAAVTQIGRVMVVMGCVLVVVGLAVWGLGRLGFRGLPGDIVYESEGTKIHVPIVTCIVLSALLTIGAWIWKWLSRP